MPTNRVKVRVSDNHSKAKLTFLPPNGAAEALDVSADQLLKIIQHMGEAHQTMMVGREIPQLKGRNIKAVINPSWFLNPTIMGEAIVLSFYHTAFGPLGFIIPMDQAERLATGMNRMAEMAKQHRKAAAN